MKTIPSLTAFLLLTLVAVTDAAAQLPLYISKSADRRDIEAVGAADSVTFQNNVMNVYHGAGATPYAASKVLRVIPGPGGRDTGAGVLRLDGGSSLGAIPKSIISLLNFTIAPSPDLVTLGAAQEAEVTDSAAEGYSDFVGHFSWPHQITITYQDASATVSGSAEGVTLAVNGAHVVVRSSAEGVEYVLKGATANGSFKIYGDKKARITLSGVRIENPQGPAFNNQCKKRTFIVLAPGSDNRMTDGESYTPQQGEDQKGCLFSEGQLLISGTGSLSVTACHKNGIVSDDYVRVIGGAVHIASTAQKGAALKGKSRVMIGGGAVEATTSGSASRGIVSDSLVILSGGWFTSLSSGGAVYDASSKDYSASAGIKADGDILISGGNVSLLATGIGGKGISGDANVVITGGRLRIVTEGERVQDSLGSASPKGIKADKDLTIRGGDIRILGTGGDGAEGMESKHDVTIYDGQIIAVCYDDGINATDGIIIHGGKLFISSSGNDGIDSNGYIYIKGGDVFAMTTSSKQAGIDNDGKTFSIEGGQVIAMGENAGIPYSNLSKQPSLLCRVIVPAPYVYLQAADGSDILTLQTSGHLPMSLLVSSPKLKVGDACFLHAARSLSGGAESFGTFSTPAFDAYAQLLSFTLSSMVTQLK